MVLRLSILRAMAATGKAAPKPKFASRTAAPKAAPLPPLPAAPPPVNHGAADGSGQSSHHGGGGGGLGYQILMVVCSMFGVILAMRMVSGLFGPRQIKVIHKDSNGNIIR
eukprot:TRINITY_DN105277_c0_g1_i1.p1 TRINITY_DN105277_c0_g1~~TRINITY_DN105277_c0_g1_i1.p1  ORF type:complete len:110 (+),score=20.41 TRINITY_DN105277_c0_g1_i1:44-373(+)